MRAWLVFAALLSLAACSRGAAPATPAPPPAPAAPPPARAAPTPAPAGDADPFDLPSDAAEVTSEECSGDAHADFDFWLGRWKVVDGDGKVVGHNVIDKAQQGCVVVERWRGAKGATGMSVNYIDPTNGEWVQLWLDGKGGEILLRGGPRGDGMRLSGHYTRKDGTRTGLRGTWTPRDDGSVLQHFEESTDGWKTWKTWFKGVYLPVGDAPE